MILLTKSMIKDHISVVLPVYSIHTRVLNRIHVFWITNFATMSFSTTCMLLILFNVEYLIKYKETWLCISYIYCVECDHMSTSQTAI